MPIDHTELSRRLVAYLKVRAEREGVPMELTPSQLEAILVKSGAGSAFGIVWDHDGRLFRDRQEPEPGFLDRWRAQTGDGRVLPGIPTHGGG